MEPLRPEQIERARRSGATDADLAEYNRLIAERFTTNPYLQTSPEEADRTRARERRIGDLHQLLFANPANVGNDAPEAASENSGFASRLLRRLLSHSAPS